MSALEHTACQVALLSTILWIDMGRKVEGLLCPFLFKELGPHVTHRLGRGLPP